MRAKVALAVLTTTATILFLPGVASAHEEADVGPIHLEVGFGTEPAYVGQPNSVQLILSRHDGADPILDLGDSLSVTVSFGENLRDPIPLEPNFEPGGDGIQGDYRAWFIPTQAGSYTFHFKGTVDETQIDKAFIAGPKTFSVVEEASSATFPKVTFPANSELASRIERDAGRTQSAIDTATSGAADAKDTADSAKTVGIIGIVVGAIGLIVGAVALSSARKRA
ncbi:MAG: hypothetical protein ACXWEG_10660 [Actinomycetota bacterium]